ncbi:PH domain-containing protein [Streptomyces sp. NPDC001700]|uniref:PH domain-containing protein n=1 Tax=Streptomyces sp. NPDC059850 TaxID=3346970 RepID=UPI00365DBB01
MSAAAQPPALPVTFRPTRTRVILLTTGAALVVTLTMIAVLLENLSPGQQASFIGTGLLFFAFLVLFSRPKVVADEAGVTVVNLVTTRRLAWAEVLRVNLRPGDAWVYLDLADGTSLPAMGIQVGVAKARAIDDARALRTLAEHHSSGGGTS